MIGFPRWIIAARGLQSSAVATQLRSRDRFEAGFVRGLAELPHGVLRRIVGKPVVLDGQQLHIEAQLVLKLLAATGAPELNRMTATEGRAQVASDAKKFEGPQVPVARAEAVS